MAIDTVNLGFGLGQRAVYASDPNASRGRLVEEPASLTRSDFQRDRDRIVHSTAFRRLKHKTQVFVADEGDHFRTRLTHTIEVAQIARALARALKLDEDLAEGIALVHDFGHPPFGHTGEEVLDEMLSQENGFDHNAQSLSVVTRLERRYAEFDGLNLTWETLEGLVKHNGPLTRADGTAVHGSLPAAIRDYNALNDLELSSFASLEAQVAAVADDIAYNTHDIDDGLRAGLLTHDMLGAVPFLDDLMKTVRNRYSGIDHDRLTHEIMRRQITAMVEDVIGVAQDRLAEDKPQSVSDVRAAGRPIAVFSPRIAEADRAIKALLYDNLYRHPSVMEVRRSAARIVRDLFDAYCSDPAQMGGGFGSAGAQTLSPRERRLLVADYLAGMTDTYAVEAHRRLFDQTPELR